MIYLHYLIYLKKNYHKFKIRKWIHYFSYTIVIQATTTKG